MIGLVEPVKPMTSWFKTAGDWIVLLGDTKEDLAEPNISVKSFRTSGTPPFIELEKESALHALCLSAIQSDSDKVGS
jgi:hypothetical protein